MTLHEPPMTVWYWQQIGGTLIEEFVLVRRTAEQGKRVVDALIIPSGERVRLPPRSPMNIEGKDVVIVQTKSKPLGMNLMGQTLFSLQLVLRFFNPRSARAVALCTRNDRVLQPMLQAFEGCEVVVCPRDIWNPSS